MECIHSVPPVASPSNNFVHAAYQSTGQFHVSATYIDIRTPMTTTTAMRGTAPLGHVGAYIVDRRIGNGSFSTVFLAHSSSSPPTPVAIKSILRTKLSSHKQLLQNLEREIEIMKSMDHNNMTRLLEVIETEKHIYLIMEHCNAGDLHRLIRSSSDPKRTPMSIDLILHLSVQLLDGLQYLSERGLVHRDVKPHNLLLHMDTPTSRARLKFADFGFARALEPAQMAQSMCCSPLYAAPELLRGDTYDARIDLWSAGIVLYELLTGRVPFRASSPVELLKSIVSHPNIQFPSTQLAGADALKQRRLQDVIQGLLQLTPTMRWTAERAKQHLLGDANSSDTKESVTTGQVAPAWPGEYYAPGVALIEYALARTVVPRIPSSFVCYLITQVLPLIARTPFPEAHRWQRWQAQLTTLADDDDDTDPGWWAQCLDELKRTAQQHLSAARDVEALTVLVQIRILLEHGSKRTSQQEDASYHEGLRCLDEQIALCRSQLQ